jgi:hypothetical protein
MVAPPTTNERGYTIGTTDADLQELASRRPGLTVEALKAFGACKWKGEFWLPSFSYSSEGKCIPINLYPWRVHRDSAPFPKAAPGTSHGLIGLNLWDPSLQTVYLCEGHWDPIALSTLPLPRGNIIGYAGSSFPVPTSDPTRFLKLLAGKQIVMLPDNDEAGRNGLKALTSALAEHKLAHQIVSFRSINWPAGTPNGFDIRDVVRTHNAEMPKDIKSVEDVLKAQVRLKARFDAKEIAQDEFQRLSISLDKHLQKAEAWKASHTPAHSFITANLKRQIIVAKASTIQPEDITSFEGLLEILRSELHTDETWEQILAALIAITLAPRVYGPNPMLWAFLVGDAGTGKTLLLELLAASAAHIMSLSRFNGLYSGIGKGAGILDDVNGRTLGIKDFTTLLSNPQTLERILGELRDVFDGHADVHFLNGKHINVRDMKFSIIACTTPAIHKYSDADRGARFLFIDMSTRIKDGKFHFRHVDKYALVKGGVGNLVESLSTGSTDNATDRCKAATWGFLEYLTTRLEDASTVANICASVVEADPTFIDWISALGQWVGAARSVADLGVDKIRQEAEAGTRLGKQFFLHAMLIFVVYGEDFSPEGIQRVKTILLKIGYDTGFGWQQDLMLFLAAKPESLRSDALKAMGVASDTTMQRIVKSAKLLGIVEEASDTASMGRPASLLSLTPEYANYAEVLGFLADPDLRSLVDEPVVSSRQTPAVSRSISRQLPSFTRSLARRPSSDPITG